MENIDNLQEMTCLSQAVHGEAGNQSLKGKIAVAHVIVNRTKDKNFPSDICGVIRQKGQFGFLKRAKKINENNTRAVKQMEDSIKATWLVMNDKVEDPTKGSVYFINPKLATDRAWLHKFRRIVRIEDHVFYSRQKA